MILHDIYTDFPEESISDRLPFIGPNVRGPCQGEPGAAHAPPASCRSERWEDHACAHREDTSGPAPDQRSLPVDPSRMS